MTSRLTRALTSALLVSFLPLTATAQQGEGLRTVGPWTAPACTHCVPVTISADRMLRHVIDNELPPEGGEILLLPGTYEFDNTVLIRKSNVTIRGTSATVLKARSMVGPGLFDVEGHNFTLEGVRVMDQHADPGASLVSIGGNNARIVDCDFEIRVNGSAKDYAVIELYGEGNLQGNETPTRQGVRISGNSFFFPTNVNAGNHVVGIRARGGRGLRVTDNHFRGGRSSDPIETGLLKHAMELRNESHGVIANNVFTNLGYPSVDGIPGSILYVENTVDRLSEGHHMVVNGNFFEECAAEYVMHLAGGRFYSITGNVMGRCIGAILLTGGSSTGAGESNIISGNQFHNVGLQRPGSDERSVAILAQGQNGLSIASNQFTLCEGIQIDINTDVELLHIVANQFVANHHSPGCNPEAINLRALLSGPACTGTGVGYHVRENTSHGVPGRSWERTVRPSNYYSACAVTTENWNFLSNQCP